MSIRPYTEWVNAQRHMLSEYKNIGSYSIVLILKKIYKHNIPYCCDHQNFTKTQKV